LTFLLILRILRSIAAGLVNLILPYLVLIEMHQSLLFLGLIYTAATISSALLGMSFGFTADLFGRRKTFLLALALFPISTSLIYLSRHIIIIFIAAVLGGYAASGSLASGGVGGYVAPIQSTITTEITSRSDRTFYFSILSFTTGVASAFGALIAGLLTISTVFGLATILGTFSTLLTFFIRTREATHGKLKMRSRVVIGKFSVTGILNGLTQGLITPFLIPFFILTYGIQENQMGVYTAISGSIAAASLLLAPQIERRLRFLKGIIVTRGMSAALMLIFPFVRILFVSIVIYCVIPALRVTALPVQQTAITDRVNEEELGRAFGLNQAARLISSSTGTAFAGYEFNFLHIEVPFILYALVLWLNIYLYYDFFLSIKIL
jgi:MFS family permease